MGSLTPPKSTTLTSPSSPSTSHLPAILCLHGGGSNSAVFKIQTRRLYWRLSTRFRFVFVQGTLPGNPGWGMLPVFESLAPFYHWISNRFQLGDADVEITPKEEVRVMDENILRAMEENGGRESFVGVMGFSQGARVAAGMVLRQQIEVRDQGWSKWNFRFAVIIGGPYPPIGLLEDGGRVEVEDYRLIGQMPTVHAWGRDDQARFGAKDMADACDGTDTFVMDFEGGHHLPLTDKEAEELCGLIVDAWHAGGGNDKSGLVASVEGSNE